LFAGNRTGTQSTEERKGYWFEKINTGTEINSMFIFVAVIAVIIFAVYIFMQGAPFGTMPSGKRLEAIQHSPHYADGKFQNLSFTPDLAEGTSYYRVMRDFFFRKSGRNRPGGIIPSKKTNLFTLPPDKNILVWFGHSSYFMQVDGKKILVDPVFCGHASPFSFTTRSYKGSDAYTVDDIPAIDILFISHDHWDHLDHETISKLKPKIARVITGLGTAAHLERWGYDTRIISEKDWYEEIMLDKGFIVHTLPARHFSGRGFRRNQSLWMSFALRTPTMNIYLGGDSGYDTHFAEIGEKYGPFDLAILECGQYNAYWKYIHMTPEELVHAAQELKAAKVLPVHWAKFSLALHAWDDPIIRVIAEGEKQQLALLYPMIGETVDMRTEQSFIKWWEQVPDKH
jgi:L-ascorbate metabolism protein UlaG (beta-lactamase superfamily)